MQAFFSKRKYEASKEVKLSIEKPPAEKKAPQTRAASKQKELTCEDCGFDLSCMSPRLGCADSMHGTNDVLVVFKQPSSEADKTGTAGNGTVERTILDLLAKRGITKPAVTYAIQCYPNTQDVKKVNQAGAACSQNLHAIIQKVKPFVIITVGTTASKSVLGKWVHGMSAKDIAGAQFPYYPYDAWVVPLIDTTKAVLKNRQFVSVIKADIDAIDVQKPLPPKMNFKDEVVILSDFCDVQEYLYWLKKQQGSIVFDYETTRKRGQGFGAAIACVGISVVYSDGSYSPATVIPVENPHFFTSSEQDVICNLLGDIFDYGDFDYIAQNAPFEDEWTRARLFSVASDITLNWRWCTMNAEHIIDERPLVTGLKYQLTRYYGENGYDDHIEPFIKKADERGVNHVFSANQAELFLYCGVDVAGTRQRYFDQKAVIESDAALSDCMKLFMDGINCFCQLHARGLYIDTNHYDKTREALLAEIASAKAEMHNDPDLSSWETIAGRTFNPSSPKDVKEFFIGYLNVQIDKQSASGEASTDKDSLARIDHPVVKSILKFRALDKVVGTYIEGFTREIVGDRLYPIFQLHTTQTGRSSSANPNFQNVPKRDKRSQELCRRGIKTPPGFRIFEIDYSGIEVKMCGCYTKDPVLLKYLNDDTSDMHYDLSEEVFLCPRNNLTKAIRNIGKNSVTFPWFYGSYHVTIAAGLWEQLIHGDNRLKDGTSLSDWVFSQHIEALDKRTGVQKQLRLNTLPNFTEHIKQVEQRFWSKFKQFKAWQDAECTAYDINLETENFFGFKRRRELSKNMIINTPFQGTAFQCLLWALIRCNGEMVKRGYKSHIVGQIHDAIVGYVHPSEEQEVFSLLQKIMVHDLQEAHNWINVPMDVELDVSEVNGNWFELSTWVQTEGVWHKK